ncbi:MAG: hypothetical protein EOP84_11270 [Verrucomicrobiaceae bacterium]|nr:MAG: hypothetical protein EOP84_11270 [Verrucomicrobiaceae bacterium]
MRAVLIAAIFALVACAENAQAAKHRLRDDPVEGICDTTVKSLSGYFSVSEQVTKNYFFWFFESRSSPSTDPLVIWLTGN